MAASEKFPNEESGAKAPFPSSMSSTCIENLYPTTPSKSEFANFYHDPKHKRTVKMKNKKRNFQEGLRSLVSENPICPSCRNIVNKKLFL
jgi:hypothetical protein